MNANGRQLSCSVPQQRRHRKHSRAAQLQDWAIEDVRSTTQSRIAVTPSVRRTSVGASTHRCPARHARLGPSESSLKRRQV